jgi:hypothetical protein
MTKEIFQSNAEREKSLLSFFYSFFFFLPVLQRGQVSFLSISKSAAWSLLKWWVYLPMATKKVILSKAGLWFKATKNANIGKAALRAQGPLISASVFRMHSFRKSYSDWREGEQSFKAHSPPSPPMNPCARKYSLLPVSVSFFHQIFFKNLGSLKQK